MDLSTMPALDSHPESLQYVVMGRRGSTPHKQEEYKVGLVSTDRKKVSAIAFCVVMQCVAVFVGSVSVLNCFWSPNHFQTQSVKIIMVMYLYDHKKCGLKLGSSKSLPTIELHRLYNTTGTNVKPLHWAPIVKSTSTRLTQSTITHMEISIVLHALWMASAIISWICCQIRKLNYKYFKRVMTVFTYSIVLMVIFDVSMGILYVAHIQQSLTKSMILRYAGWATELKVDNPEAFGGWIPIVASVCWLRGLLFLILNILSVRTIWFIRKKIKKKEVIVRHAHKKNAPIPERLVPTHEISADKTLVYHP